MNRRTSLCLYAALIILLCQSTTLAGPRKGPGVPVDGVPFVNSRRVQINFQSGSYTKVSLFVSRDRGKTWQPAEAPAPTQPPIFYDAAEDGLFGFFIVLENEAGQSSPPPQNGTSPQQWVRIDTAQPSVQLLGMKADDDFIKNREVRMRWRCDDENLTDRPVAIHYRTEVTKIFVPIADSLPANSEYRWSVPDRVKGRVEVKLTASDLAGKTGEYKTDRLLIDESGAHTNASAEGSAAAPSTKHAGPPASLSAAYSEPDADGRPATPQVVKEAKKLYDQGTYHRLRGEP